MAGADATVDVDTEAAPHRPVLLRVAFEGRNVPMLVVTKIAALDRVVGPLPAPSARAGEIVMGLQALRDDVRRCGAADESHTRRLDGLCRRWYQAAFAEIAAATGKPPVEYVEPRIQWVAPTALAHGTSCNHQQWCPPPDVRCVWACRSSAPLTPAAYVRAWHLRASPRPSLAFCAAAM